MAANYPYASPYSSNMMPMAPQYGSMMPQDYRQVSQSQPQFGLKGRPVSSLEEVRGTTIDFDGSIFYFPDIANKRIYTKQINLDGTAALNVYELKQIPIQNSDYITRQEFESVLKELKVAISTRFVPQVQQEQPQVMPVQQETHQPQQQAQPKNTPIEPLKF